MAIRKKSFEYKFYNEYVFFQMQIQTVMALHFIFTWFFLVEIFIKLINDFRNFWLEGFEVLNFFVTTSSCYVFITSVCSLVTIKSK